MKCRMLQLLIVHAHDIANKCQFSFAFIHWNSPYFCSEMPTKIKALRLSLHIIVKARFIPFISFCKIFSARLNTDDCRISITSQQ